MPPSVLRRDSGSLTFHNATRWAQLRMREQALEASLVLRPSRSPRRPYQRADRPGSIRAEATEETSVSTDENKRLVRRFYEAIDAGNLDAMDELVAEDYVDHSPPPFPFPPGREGLK